MLSSGTTLGPYRILAPLGAGGMGEVYRAQDTRLGRDVAVKALPEAFAHDPERLARFEREARLLASLNHSNIAAIHGLEEVGGQRYLILEFVEGETLQGRLARGPLPLHDSLHVCRQIATALEVAHESGVVHRDLKPGNVMITPTGDVKVLDLGLAKGAAAAGVSSDANLSESPTLSFAATAAGVILGTAAYMSPEQARGRGVDKRTDIWSFGCLLLECLTGRQAFAGETASDIIAKILERAPDLDALPARTPSRVKELLQRCLQKDSRERLRDIGDARLELERAIAEVDSGVVAAATDGGRGARAAARLAWGVAAVAVAVAALSLALLWLRPATVAPPTRFIIAAPKGNVLTTAIEPWPALSPDGRAVAFTALDSIGISHLWVRPLDEVAPRMIPGTDNARMAIWSPDGRSLAFGADLKLKKVATSGGEVEVLCAATSPRGGSWSTAGTIVFAPGADGPLYKVSAAGGAPVAVTALDSSRGETAHRFPMFLEDGRHFVFVALPPRAGRFSIQVGSVDGMRPKPLLEADDGVAYAGRGWILFPRGFGLMAQRFDLRSFKPLGEPQALPDSPDRGATKSYGGVSASWNGALVYIPRVTLSAELAWYGMDGRLLAKVPLAPGPYRTPVPSPDGSRFAMVRPVTSRSDEIWVLDGVRGITTRVCDAPGHNAGPLWSPDGRSIIYQSDRDGPVSFYRVDLSAADAEETVYTSPVALKNLMVWPVSRDGVLFEQFEASTGSDLWWLPLQGDRKPIPLVRSPASEGNAADVSPDGEWLVYDSDVSGRNELYVRPFAGGRDVQVTTTGSASCFWRKGGREILSIGGDLRTVTAIPFEPGSPPRVGSERSLFVAAEGTNWIWYDAFGDRFLTTKSTTRREPPAMTVLLNWTSALKKP